MKPYILYLAACGLQLVLLFLFSHLQLYRRHPVFMVWLLAAPLANLAVWVLMWTGEFQILARAEVGLDILDYGLLLAALTMAVVQWHDPTSAILRRGIIALFLFSLAGRFAANLQWAGGLGVLLANLTNATFLAPVAYIVVKLSGLRLERIPLFLREDRPWAGIMRHALQFAQSLRG